MTLFSAYRIGHIVHFGRLNKPFLDQNANECFAIILFIIEDYAYLNDLILS